MAPITIDIPSLNRQQISLRVPHAGTMCLLDSATAWDEEQIVARAVSHRALDNPLRQDHRLSALCAVEYAGQAMALHGSLVSGTRNPAPGFLASLREVEFTRRHLDDLPSPLVIKVRKLAGDGSMLLYCFEVASGEEIIATGRMAVAFSGTTA